MNAQSTLMNNLDFAQGLVIRQEAYDHFEHRAKQMGRDPKLWLSEVLNELFETA